MFVGDEAGQGPADEVQFDFVGNALHKRAAATHAQVHGRLGESRRVSVVFCQKEEGMMVGVRVTERKLFRLHGGKGQLSRAQPVIQDTG
ncbi:hypothetical protein D3C87_2008230 [compost metagenome]